MQSENPPTRGRTSTAHAVRHHLAVVICCVALGALAGWLYVGTVTTTYTSTARVLVNPSVGNPYAPTPASVRQDEATSLETEAQVVRSDEVLAPVAEETTGLTVNELERGVQVIVPPNTQVLEITYAATNPLVAQRVVDAVADAYLANRVRRFNQANAARIERVETRTQTVIKDLEAATVAAQHGTPAQRLFHSRLAVSLGNELTSLRAQRTALENSESPAGAVISPASSPKSAQNLTTMVIPVGGALAGLALGCLLAVLLERLRGVVRAPREVEETGLPVVATFPTPGFRARLFRKADVEAVGTTVRRLRATILDLEPRPDVIAVAPAGTGKSDADVSEAVAESFAKAGHRVVLVQTDRHPSGDSLGLEERGLAQALLHERLNVLDMLQPSVDPLLSVLPDGRFTAKSRELLVADRLRAVLAPLTRAGHLVVLQSPGLDTAEGEAIVGAADLGLVVVTIGRTRPREVDQVVHQASTRKTDLAALVLGHERSARRALRASRAGGRRDADGIEADGADELDVLTKEERSRAPR